MVTNPALGLLRLSRRAGRLACGEDAVGVMVAEGKCRAIFIARDIGDASRRKVMRHDARVPVFELPCDRETLGAEIGVQGCAACAVSDIGMANALAEKLRSMGGRNGLAAARVADKKAHIDSRKGKKKTRGEKPRVDTTDKTQKEQTQKTKKPKA